MKIAYDGVKTLRRKLMPSQHYQEQISEKLNYNFEIQIQ